MERMDYLEFIARTTSHIPNKGQVTVRYRGRSRRTRKPSSYIFVQMVYSSLAEPGHVLELASECGWDWSVVVRQKRLFETYLIWKLTPRKG
jgi:hypothetical protein